MSNLIIKDLHKNFGKKQVVRGIDFSMTTGEVLGLLGPNGAGKTTTFYMIVGFYRPNTGSVFIDDTWWAYAGALSYLSAFGNIYPLRWIIKKF